jgi:polyhydroxyalkanoate synthase subunit PhaC
MTPDLPGGDLLAGLRREVDRNVYRTRNGIRYLTGGEWAQVDPTPSDIVFEQGKVKLRHYHRDTPARFGPPVLAFLGLVSRSYILDLRRGNSFVQRLIDAGFDTFVLDWGEPDETDAQNTLETYVQGYMPRAVDAMLEETGSNEINVIGYCMGGNLALLALASQPDGPWRNLVTMATPIDFRKGGPLIDALRDGRIDVDSLIDETGNVPGSAVEHFFRIRHPTARAVMYANLWENLWNDDYMEGFQAMGRWVNEQIPIAGVAARQLIDSWVRENAFFDDSLRLGGRRISLADIYTPAFCVIADRDEIVPQPMAMPIIERLSGTSPDVLHVDAGHTSLTTGRIAGNVTIPKVTEWLAAHSEELT